MGFIKEFARLIDKEPKKLVANYMMWRVVQESLPLLSKSWRTLSKRSVRRPEVSEEPRWKYCVSSIRNNLGMA
ncbi:Endothelin-converting enzyme 1, partial [Stegodyphus mimosarum]